MSLNPGERQLLQDLLERVRRLEQARAPSAGVGLFVETQHGVTYAKTPQPGFPAELTGSYNATTGYPARRLTLQTTGTVGLVVPTTPETFTRLFAADGNTSLTSGTKGWAEPLPDGTGYLFTQSGTATASTVFLRVRVATTQAGTLASSFENGDTVDGLVLATGNRVLIKNQADARQNGVYTVNASGSPTRVTDTGELAGCLVLVDSGTANADTYWFCTNDSQPVNVGTDNITFRQANPTSGETVGSLGTPGFQNTTTNTWESTGVSFTLPSPGTYLLVVKANLNVRISSHVSLAGNTSLRVYDVTAGAALSNAQAITPSNWVDNQSNGAFVTIQRVLTIATPTTYRLETFAGASGADPTYDFTGTGMVGGTDREPVISWVKVA